MSKIEIHIDNTGNLDNLLIKYEKTYDVLKSSQVKKIAGLIIKKLRYISRQRRWKTIPKAIEQSIISDNEIIIHPSAEKENLFRWLHYGTKRHYIRPVNAQALSWVQGRKRRFSKGHFVSGIKPTYFFKVTPDMVSEIKLLIESFKGLMQK